MTPRREPKKCREWEKIRRDKLNNAFSVLSKLLPNHDPALTWSKVDILHRATEYIEELQVKLKNVLTTEGVNKTKRCEVKMLYGRVKKLLLRNEQLCKLLKDASITIPSGYGVKNFKDPRRWANRITQEEAKEFQKEELQKENKERTVKKKKKTTTVANKHQRKVNRKAKLAPKKPPVIRLQLSNIIPLANPQPLPKVSNRPCFIITNKPTLNLPLGLQQNGKAKASTVVTNSNSLTTPKVASVIKPPLSTTTLPKVSSQTLNKLGPGTLILANGNIVPILPPSAVLPSPTILTNPTPIILKPPPANTTLIVMPPATSATSATKSVAINNNVTIHPRIRPKPITCTTQSNKVPIPAIPRFKETITEKVITKKKEVENKTNKKTKRKVANNQFPNKKSKPAPVNKPQADENKENKVENPAVSANESEIVEKEPPVNKENAPEEVPGVNEEKMDTVEQSEIVAPVIEDKTTEEVQDSIPKEKDPPVEAPAKSQEQDKINTPPPTTTSELAVNLNHSELSNDIFSTLQVPIGGQNPESTSPTAAFLLAFPLVSSLTGVKVTEVIEEENSDSRHGTPTLLQIGTMETTKTTQSVNAESLTPNLLNLDNFSFFSANNFYPSFDNGSVVDSAKISSACAKVTDVSSTAKVASTTSTSLPVYSTEPAIVSKPTMSVVSNSFTQQTPAVSYSKPSLPPPLVTSSYLQNSVPTNNCTSTQRKPADMQYNPVSIAQCNAFNPFSDFSKPNSYPSFSKSYSDPLYTNSNYGYGHHNETNFNQNVYYPPKSSKPNNAYNATNYSEISYNSSDSRKRHMPYYHQNKTQPKPNTKSTKTNPKPPINWMTTPDFRSQPPSGDYLVPPIDYNPNTFYTSSSTHTTYFNTTSSMYPSTEFQNSIGDNRKAFDSSLPILPTNSSQRNEFEENQFPWSPTKLPQFLETPHTFVSSTLPTLVGDLALGTAQTQFNEQKGEQPKTKESTRRSKVNSVTYDNQSNFLSVSQLVENKTEASSSRTTTRRNSGNRNVKSNSQKKRQSPSKTRNC
ncbi:nuclear pore complex protein DDB_G0274915-like [Photinus pyralis]|uniref:nuclear pore complex protein DDB_G0274915-like n=1 Tax=Photinus pyralis TaxID=7054 RepID=UPI0012672258|nr:nuclear pore complex protein DDB_G0274915-like [Photinus pyralis]